jgi:hypothetical protein
MTADKLFGLSALSLAIGGLLTFTSWILFAIFNPGHQYYQHRGGFL